MGRSGWNAEADGGGEKPDDDEDGIEWIVVHSVSDNGGGVGFLEGGFNSF